RPGGLTGERPAVDVVVPFAGSADALGALVARLEALHGRSGDTVTIADNRRRRRSRPESRSVRVLDATRRRGSYRARNAGARAGSAPWLLFVDADVEPPRDLLDRLFQPLPGGPAAV